MKRALTFMAIMAAGITIANPAQWAAFDDHYFATRVTWTPISGLIAHYKMNDNAANTTVVDGYGSYNGTAKQNTANMAVSGKIGGALSFDGNADAIDCGTSLLGAGLHTNGTIAFWVNMQGLGGAADMAWAKGEYYAVVGFTTAKVQYYVNPTGSYFSASSIPVDGSAWRHVAVTWTAGGSQIYINGAFDSTNTITLKLMAAAGESGKFLIGGLWSFTTYGINGDIDDFRLYNRALTSNEVYRIWNNGDGTEAQ